jgi:nucleotide-binding universal stress UspA family protein
VQPRVIVGVSGRGSHPRVVDTAVSLARGTGAVLYAVDVRDDHTGDGYRVGPPAMQDAYHALSRSSDDLSVRIVVTPGDPHETLLRLANRPDDRLVLGHRRRQSPRDTGRPVALRCAAAARSTVVIVPGEHPEVAPEAKPESGPDMASTSADRYSWMQAARCVKLDRHALADPDPRATDRPRLCLRCPVQATRLGWALIMWISTGRQCREQCVQVGDMSVTLPRPVRGVVVGGGR